jgi:hypothetical protein
VSKTIVNVDCLEKAIDQGDVKAALEVLKRLRLFAPGPIGSDDPAELASEAQVEAAERQDDLKMRAMMAEWESLQQKISENRLPDRSDPLLLPNAASATT